VRLLAHITTDTACASRSIDKVDDESGDILRDTNGLCIACRPGETGAMVSTIKKRDPMLVFEGYLNKSETNKKIISDVFVKGDQAFVTGDILRWDRLGYVYFKDRTGDTFRWKGENVSTTEVEAVLHPIKCVTDAAVYGVQIPGTEGRAGMAAIALDEKLSTSYESFLDEVTDRFLSTLPAYAIPVFIRFCKTVELTGTFKLQRTNLQRQSFHQCPSTDHIYFWNCSTKKYIPLDRVLLEKIDNGQIDRF